MALHSVRQLAAAGAKGSWRDWHPDADSILGALVLDAGKGKLFAGGAWQTFRQGSIRRPHFAIFS